jgi:hypothetical protein
MRSIETLRKFLDFIHPKFLDTLMLWGHNRNLGHVCHHVVCSPKSNSMTTGLAVGHQILFGTFSQDLTHPFLLPYQTYCSSDFGAAGEAAATHCEPQ